MRRGRILLLSAALAVGLFGETVAEAALVAIDPVKVLLTGAAPSRSISLRNNGSERVRFQMSAFTWQQSSGGEMQLAPTPDLVFFPSLLELAPGQAVPAIHRSYARAHSLCSVGDSTVQVTGPASAYPRAFPGALASWAIPPPCGMRLAPSPRRESTHGVTSFLNLVFCRT
jgi:hypothetical protein